MQKLQRNDKAVTELIGVVLLISVAVVAIGIVAVVLLSEPLPEKIPNVDILITNGTETVYIAHSGGEPVGDGEITVYVNGVLVTETPKIEGGDEAWPWTIGETLNVNVTDYGEVTDVYVVYSGGSTDVLLKSKRLTGTSADIGTDAASTPFTIPDCYDPINDLLNDSIYLSQDLYSASGEWILEGDFNFTMTDDSSHLIFANPGVPGPDTYQYNFSKDERITIRCFENIPSLGGSKIRIFSIGSIGWYINAKSVYVYEENTLLKESNKELTTILAGRLTGYDEANSRLNITSKLGANPGYTLLIINNSREIDAMRTKNDPPIIITGLKPTIPTIFILDTYANQDKAPSYFVGKAENVTYT
jgi:FlaG/FlaF family flagellin (archaellin)